MFFFILLLCLFGFVGLGIDFKGLVLWVCWKIFCRNIVYFWLLICLIVFGCWRLLLRCWFGVVLICVMVISCWLNWWMWWRRCDFLRFWCRLVWSRLKWFFCWFLILILILFVSWLKVIIFWMMLLFRCWFRFVKIWLFVFLNFCVGWRRLLFMFIMLLFCCFVVLFLIRISRVL